MQEEIIIDGVNVAGCINFDEWKHCDNCKSLIKTIKNDNGTYRNPCVSEEDLRCEFYPDCYYKQLKRLEQERDELKQENKRLNESLYCYAYEKGCYLQCKQKDCAIKNYYRYKPALEEIREILNAECGIVSNAKAVGIINEVLNEGK